MEAVKLVQPLDRERAEKGTLNERKNHQNLVRKLTTTLVKNTHWSRDRNGAKHNRARTGLATVTWLPTVGIHCLYNVNCSDSSQKKNTYI